MKLAMAFLCGIFLAQPAFSNVEAKNDGFYVKGVSASTLEGASLLVEELATNEDHDICYAGDYESALESVHDSISIAINDVYGESEYPDLDADVTATSGQSASGIISACN